MIENHISHTKFENFSFVLCVYINIPVHQPIFFLHPFQFSIIFNCIPIT